MSNISDLLYNSPNLPTTPTYGVNVLTNGDFSSGSTGWTLGTGWTVTGNQAVLTNNTGSLSTTVNVTSGVKYILNFSVIAGSATFIIQVGSLAPITVNTGVTSDVTFVSNVTGPIAVSFAPDLNNGAANITIDTVTIKPVVKAATTNYLLLKDATGNVSASLTVHPFNTSSVSFGTSALINNLTGIYNTAFGFQALQHNTTGYSNTAVGSNSTQNNTTGYNNTAYGTASLSYNTVGSGNTAIGVYSLLTNATGYNNVAVGINSLRDNISGRDNTAVGTNSLMKNTTAINNTAVGQQSLTNNTTGSGNTAVGVDTLRLNTIGFSNVAVGIEALYRNTTGYSNTAVGVNSLVYAVTGLQNTAVGTASLSQTVGGYNNTAAGVASATFNTNGNSNVAIGTSAYFWTSMGTRNTAIGDQAGNIVQYGATISGVVVTNGIANQTLGLATGEGNIFLCMNTDGGFSNGTPYLFYNNGTQTSCIDHVGSISGTINLQPNIQWKITNTSCVGYNTSISGSNQVQLGDSLTTTYVYGTVQNRSDSRDKTDIRDTVLGLDFIKALRPVDFKWDMRDDYYDEVIHVVTDDNGKEQTMVSKVPKPKDGTKIRNRYHHGLLAQEVKQLIEQTGVDFGGYQDHSIAGGLDRMTIGYDELVAPLIKAIQQQQELIEALTARVDALENPTP